MNGTRASVPAIGSVGRAAIAASKFGRLEGFAYQSPPPSYCSRAIVIRGVRAAVVTAVIDAASSSTTEVLKSDPRIIMNLKVAVTAGVARSISLLPAPADRRRSARFPAPQR